MSNERMDAAEAVFFKRQLEYVKARTYDTKYKQNRAMLFIPVSSEAPSGATEITWRKYTKYGYAKVVADYATDFPRVDVFGEETTIKIHTVGASYGYSLMEIRRAMLAGMDLEARRSVIARDVIMQKHNTIALSGDTASNISGLIGYSGLTEYTVPATGTGSTKTWSTKTADQILVDLNGIRDAIVEGTNGVERPTLMLLPIAQYNLLKNTRIGSTSDKTIFQFWSENNPDITIDWLDELDGAGTGSTDRFMAYPKDPEHITLEIPVMFEQHEPDKIGLQYWIPCTGQTAGVLIYYPTAFAFGDGI